MCDNGVTDALNEAKDNVKYLSTLERFTQPLYSGNPEAIIESLPALMNNVKMMLTIARYYSTQEHMTTLFVKITNQMIKTCKKNVEYPDPEGSKSSFGTRILRTFCSGLK